MSETLLPRSSNGQIKNVRCNWKCAIQLGEVTHNLIGSSLII